MAHQERVERVSKVDTADDIEPIRQKEVRRVSETSDATVSGNTLPERIVWISAELRQCIT